MEILTITLGWFLYVLFLDFFVLLIGRLLMNVGRNYDFSRILCVAQEQRFWLAIWNKLFWGHSWIKHEISNIVFVTWDFEKRNNRYKKKNHINV